MILIWSGVASGTRMATLCRCGRLLEAPAYHIAGIDVVAHQSDAAETRALEIFGVEVDAVDPETAFGIDELAVDGVFDLRA